MEFQVRYLERLTKSRVCCASNVKAASTHRHTYEVSGCGPALPVVQVTDVPSETLAIMIDGVYTGKLKASQHTSKLHTTQSAAHRLLCMLAWRLSSATN